MEWRPSTSKSAALAGKPALIIGIILIVAGAVTAMGGLISLV